MAKFVIVPGALRKDSYNRKLAQVWEAFIKKQGHEAEVVSSEDLNAPLINEDIVATQFPAGIKKVADKIAAAQGVIFCSPEYNGSISPVTKNMIDWTSTLRPHPWRSKPVLLSGTSPGAFAAVVGILHTRNPLDRLGAHVFPQNFGVPHGDKEVGDAVLTDPKKQENLEKLAQEFLAFSLKIS
jgi:chromate reductase, NAD(P)H dehydrogenase (quinone)